MPVVFPCLLLMWVTTVAARLLAVTAQMRSRQAPVRPRVGLERSYRRCT